MTTYPAMNEQIVGILRFRGDSPSLYAAGRIEELEAETGRLREQSQQAEAATREAVTREAVLLEFLSRVVWLANGESAYPDYCDGRAYRCIFCGRTELEIGAEGHAENCEWIEARSLLENISPAPAALLERLAELEAQVADNEEARIKANKLLGRAAAALLEAWRRETGRLNDVPAGGIEILLQWAPTKIENLRGALQAALLPLERAADALVPEARVTEAAALVEEALVAIREELG